MFSPKKGYSFVLLHKSLDVAFGLCSGHLLLYSSASYRTANEVSEGSVLCIHSL